MSVARALLEEIRKERGLGGSWLRSSSQRR
jgi:hypothetical protein